MEKSNVISILQRSVNSLQWFHTMVLSLAVVSSVQQIISYNAATSVLVFKSEFLHNFIVFLFIVIPFHQGANRYLDETYVTENLTVHKFTGLVDFGFFFVEAILFYIMSLLIQNNGYFYISTLVVFGIDVVWLVFVYFENKALFAKIQQWLYLNLGAIVVVAIFLILKQLDETYKWYLLAFILFVRTILDYGLSWPFYWPAFATIDPVKT
jgi:hypothetical protein